MTELEIDPNPRPKIDGRTKAGRALRAQQPRQYIDETQAEPARSALRGNVREQIREPAREARGGDVVLGRNNEVLSRKRKGGIDPFHIPPEIVPKGWSYQWNVVSVVGNSDVVMDQVGGMYENGWRPVPAERHPGLFVARGKTGEIVRGGQRLEERPKALTDQARAEEIANAQQQMRDRDQSLMGGKANVRGAMRDGFEMGGKYRGTGGSLRMSIDPGIDAPAPSHTLADE
jgi:hypothetical protein